MNLSTRNAELASTTQNDARWASGIARESKTDAAFVYSVRTMGVYCQPSCAARLAGPVNVRFHATARDAEKTGFQPCKRCKPDQPTIRFAIGDCSMGSIVVAKRVRGVCAILMGNDPGQLVCDLRDQFPGANLVATFIDRKSRRNGNLELLVSKVESFVEAPAAGLDQPLDIQGTAFQRRVWRAQRGIPAGSTASYTDISNRIGSPKSVRAVAQACGANPPALAVPCHRVVRSDGALAGYRWGVERKRALLAREARA
jgi:AraC family transcriptional regulator, regulatory protein of adaptative response / methylated-DNA-[protein]-cysteine methyltransferase